MLFENAELEVIRFNAEDIIATSGEVDEQPGNDPAPVETEPALEYVQGPNGEWIHISELR